MSKAYFFKEKHVYLYFHKSLNSFSLDGKRQLFHFEPLSSIFSFPHFSEIICSITMKDPVLEKSKNLRRTFRGIKQWLVQRTCLVYFGMNFFFILSRACFVWRTYEKRSLNLSRLWIFLKWHNRFERVFLLVALTILFIPVEFKA